MDHNQNYSPTEQQAIRDLRSKILHEFDSRPDLFDPLDRDLVAQSDLWIARFLNFLDQGPERALDHMIETFKWRKEFEIHHFKKLEIPREVYVMAPLFEYYPDDEGRRMFYVRVMMHRKIALLQERIKKYFMHNIERMDRAASREHGINIVFDMTGSGYSNADLDLLFFLLTSIRKYYPNSIRYVYVLGLPWILNSMAKFALALIPSDTAKKVRFLTQAEFHDVIPSEKIPDFLGGSATKNYRIIPHGAKTCVQLGHEIFGLSEVEVTKLLKPSLRHILEGERRAVQAESNCHEE